MKKHILKLSLLLILAGVISSCQVGTLENESVEATLLSDVLEPCTENSEFDFDLELRNTTPAPQNSNNINPGFSIEGGTSIEFYAPYDYSDCACRVENYILEFDFLPALSTDLYLIDAEGEIVNSIASYNPSNGNPWLVIDHSGISSDIFIVIDDNQNPKPELISAGGICMIDNIDNPNGYTGPGPYRELEYNPKGEVIGQSYFIPGKNLSAGRWVTQFNPGAGTGGK